MGASRLAIKLGGFLVSGDGVHGGRARGDDGLELMAVDLLGDDRGAVADQVGRCRPAGDC